MLRALAKLLSGSSAPADGAQPAPTRPVPVDALEAPGVKTLRLAECLVTTDDVPIFDWNIVGTWVSTIPDATAQAEAWSAAELAWLGRILAALGSRYHVTTNGRALLVSPLDPRVAELTAQYMTRTLRRILTVLDGVARAPEWGSDILLAFEDQETYYRYVSRYYPNEGEFAFSSGMYINLGCGHFATFEAELRTIEPVIAHEMTPACLSHLGIPAWVNEGLAVNTERKLCPPVRQGYTAHQLHWMHRKFWNEERIQEFWSGKSFLRADEGNLLSYELARELTEHLSHDWSAFSGFVNAAQVEDAGQKAAQQTLGLNLGAAVAALFEFEPSARWAPDPALWQGEPERGAFRALD